MGYDVNSVTFLDPYNGYEHLKNKRLTYVNNDTFVEDPLRVLRAVQFCARFELTCSDELISLARSLCEMGAIKELPKERIFEEISKLLLKSKKPSRGLALFEILNLTKQFPEILDKNNRFTSIDAMANLKTHNHKRDMILMLGLLIFHFDTIEDVNSFLDKLTNETELIKELQTLYIYRYSLADMKQKPLTNYEISLLSTKVTIQNLLLIYEAQGIDIGEIKERSTQLGVLTCKPKALLQGRDLIALGLTPSKQFSEILEIAYDAQLQELFKSSKEAKGWLQNYLKIIC
jgi:tRNA nucleotidyltransferase (CCA-adding enzyme)